LLYLAIAFSVLLHLAVLVPFVVRFAGSTPTLEAGTEQGLPENVNVSVITDADLRSLSSVPFQQLAPPPQPVQAETQPTPEPPQEAASSAPSPAKPAREAALPDAKALHGPNDPSGFAARMAEEFTASMTRAFEDMERRKAAARSAPRPASNLRTFRPAASHNGRSDEFARAVAWALAATVPQGNGKWGNTIVTFVVSPNGQVQELRLLQSSGDNWLDTGALMAIKQTRLPTPPPGLPPGDRTFNVEYISR
jgi:protein TonB